MSNYHDLYCIPCNDYCGLDINHGREKIEAVLPALAAVRAFYDAEPEGVYGWDVEAKPFTGMHALVHWYELHRGHHVVIREEYGAMHEIRPPAPVPPSAPTRYCPGCGWPNGRHAAECPDVGPE